MYTREIKLADYGWVVHAYEPTVKEAKELGEAQRVGDWDKVYSLWPPLVKDWTCTDRGDKPLPATAEGFAQLPSEVLAELTVLVTIPRHSDPKAASDLLHTLPPAQEVKPPIAAPSQS